MLLDRKTNILTILVAVIVTAFSYGQVQLEPVCAESIETYGVSGFEGSEYVWQVNGGVIIEGDGTDTVVIRWGDRVGQYRIEVLEITSEHCSNSPSEAAITLRAPDVYLGPDEEAFCHGDSLILTAGTHYQAPYEILWQNGSSAQNYIVRYSERIWLRVIDGFGCIGTDTMNVIVNLNPSIIPMNDTINCDDNNPMILDVEDILPEGQDYNRVIWRLDDNETHSNFIMVTSSDVQIDTLTVTVIDYNDCEASDTILILPCDILRLFVNMPNTITPDGNGQNDVWNIPYADMFPNAVLEIFDRWGRLVFRSTNIADEPWNGKSKGKPLPMDSYYYVLDLNFMNSQPVVGTVNLIR